MNRSSFQDISSFLKFFSQKQLQVIKFFYSTKPFIKSLSQLDVEKLLSEFRCF